MWYLLLQHLQGQGSIHCTGHKCFDSDNAKVSPLTLASEVFVMDMVLMQKLEERWELGREQGKEHSWMITCMWREQQGKKQGIEGSRETEQCFSSLVLTYM